jgi:hypothetical protein
MQKLKAVVFVILLASIAGCNSGTGTPPELPSYKLTVTGTIRNDSGIVIPPDAKVVCVWPNGTDYSGQNTMAPTYGEATLDQATNTFSIDLSGVPPVLVVNDSVKRVELAYAHILLVSSSPTHSKRIFGPEYGPIIGAVNNATVVYHTRNIAELKSSLLWLNTLRQGFVAGTGIRTDTSAGAWDDFQPGPNTGLELTVDTVGNHFYFPKLFDFSLPYN